MKKWIALAILCLNITACGTKDESYYRLHPKEIQKALSLCPTQQPSGLSCDQLQKIASGMNKLAYQLQSNPQKFGGKILNLQEKIAQEEKQFQDHPGQSIQGSIQQKKQMLFKYLTVVKWLESPEG